MSIVHEVLKIPSPRRKNFSCASVRPVSAVRDVNYEHPVVTMLTSVAMAVFALLKEPTSSAFVLEVSVEPSVK